VHWSRHSFPWLHVVSSKGFLLFSPGRGRVLIPYLFFPFNFVPTTFGSTSYHSVLLVCGSCFLLSPIIPGPFEFRFFSPPSWFSPLLIVFVPPTKILQPPIPFWACLRGSFPNSLPNFLSPFWGGPLWESFFLSQLPDFCALFFPFVFFFGLPLLLFFFSVGDWNFQDSFFLFLWFLLTLYPPCHGVHIFPLN